jgi:2-desacetyl-2-hydroxyethyl bacteriochlorophyllide A dehydrogenase
MKAVLLRSPGDLAVEDIPAPRPREDEVLLRVEACGICGSDVRYFHGGNPWSEQTLGTTKPNPPNMVLGHEFAGRIVDVGHRSLRKRLGQRVAVLAYKACGQCYHCKIGRHNLCAHVKHIGHSAGWDELERGEYNPGGMAEFCRVWDAMAYQIPDSISPAAAALLDGLAVAIHAAGKAGLNEQALDEEFDHVLIMGSGAIGLLILQVARVFGAKFIISADSYSTPLEIATQLGADAVVNVQQEDPEDRVMEHTRGQGVNVVFDTVGSHKTFVQSLKLLRRGGRLILLALPFFQSVRGQAQEISFDPLLLSGERVVMSSANNTYPCFPLAIELMERGRVKAEPIVTHQYPLMDAAEAFRVAEDKAENEAVKVILTL